MRVGVKIKPRACAIVATVLFFAVSSLVVIIYGLKIGGIDFARSISNHVGLETYSCVLFALTNMAVIALMVWYINFLYRTHGFSKLWLGLISGIAIAMLIVSCFPFVGEGSWVSIVHRVASWTMFGMTAVFAMVTVWSLARKEDIVGAAESRSFRKRRSGVVAAAWTARARRPAIVAGLFLAYGAACLAMALFFSDFFWSYVLVIESLFIFLAFVFVLSIPSCVRESRSLK